MILDVLADGARKRVKQAMEAEPLEAIKLKALQAAEKGGRRFSFEEALRSPGVSIIAEIKKASPSKGIIAKDFPYLDIAKDYVRGGASAISVLTEPDHFLGSDRYLREIADTVYIPVLRKDFTVHEYQLYEAKLLGASAILLICAILTDEELKHFSEVAQSLKLSALVEAHDEEEIDRALKAGARIIGVNNRNLKTFAVNQANALSLRERVPKDVLFVAESGITDPASMAELADAGVDAALVGEYLMRAEHIEECLRELRRFGGEPEG